MKYQALLLCIVANIVIGADPVASFDARVVDERGAPMANIPVTGGFVWKEKEWHVTKRANKLGSVNFESVTALASVDCKLAGYYESGFNIGLEGPENGRWKLINPNPVLIMRRIVKPVPMWAVWELEIEMPRTGKAAFDLEKRDWVAPDGKGVKPDLVFTLERKGEKEEGEASLKLTFSNLGDGLIPVAVRAPGGSDFLLPREAPAAGYLPERTWRRRWTDAETPERLKLSDEFTEEVQRSLKANPPPIAYIFRVRTVLNEKGEVISALYGKMLCANAVYLIEYGGEFMWDPKHHTKTAKIELTYCLNPDGTRNLEFDVKKNLFKDLDFVNEVREPW